MNWTPPGGWDFEGWSLHCLFGMLAAAPAAFSHHPWLAVFTALCIGLAHEQAQSGSVIRWLFEVPRVIDIAAFLPGAVILALVLH